MTPPRALRSRAWRLLFRLLTAAALLVALAVGVGYRLGYRLALIRVGGGTTGGTQVDMTPEPLPAPLETLPEAPVHNVILVLGDGMGLGQVAGARLALRGPWGRLFFERMPVTGLLTTHGFSRLCPDSGSAGTALATGHRTVNGAIATGPDGTALETLVEAAREKGMVAGLVTSSYLLDATPAAFAAHVPDRGMYGAIAGQMARSGIEVLMGEATKRLDFTEQSRDRPPLSDFLRHGYYLAESWKEALAAPAPSAARLLAVFRPGVVADPDRSPRLADLASLALRRLADQNRGFFLVVEDEEPDTQSHHHDFSRMVTGVRSVETVSRLAVDFARRDRSTLVVVTADHETDGLTVVGGGEATPLEVRWAFHDHTAVPVPLFAFGPGSQELAGVRDNTEVPRVLARLLDLDFLGHHPTHGPLGEPASSGAGR